MPECDCGAHITPDFARVFGDNSGNVSACIECSRRQDFRPGGVK